MKGKKYKKWYERHKEEIADRPKRVIKKSVSEIPDPEPLSKPKIMVHGYFIYECEKCGTVFQMYLEKGLEDKVQDKKDPKKHKPVPFIIGCRKCNQGFCKHILWGIGDSDEYETLPEGASYFKNKPKEDCGVPVCNMSYHNKQAWSRRYDL